MLYFILYFCLSFIKVACSFGLSDIDIVHELCSSRYFYVSKQVEYGEATSKRLHQLMEVICKVPKQVEKQSPHKGVLKRLLSMFHVVKNNSHAAA